MAYQFQNVKLLIVEDMAPMLSLTISMMKIFGFNQIQGAKSVDAGYDLFTQHNHDLVLTDWLMEPHDGLELIRRIRKNPNSPNQFAPIILMTGYSDQSRVETARDMGVTEFLTKPFTARDLYARIVQVIEKPRQFVDTGDFFGPDRRRRKNVDYNGGEKRIPGDKNQGQCMDSGDFDFVLRDLAEEAKKL